MIINCNSPALRSVNKLKKNRKAQSKTMKNLSSGLRINNAADDAAGLCIREKMRAQIRGLTQASRNIQDGISLLQTAEGAASEAHSLLQRARELSIQGANGTLTGEDKRSIDDEIEQLKDEINNIAGNTTFNTRNLLDGSHSGEVKTEMIGAQTLSASYIKEFIINNPQSGAAFRIINETLMPRLHASFEFINPGDITGRIGVLIGATQEETLNNLRDTFYHTKNHGAATEQAAIANMDMYIDGDNIIVTSADDFSSTIDVARGVSTGFSLTGSPATYDTAGVLTVTDERTPISLQIGSSAGESMQIAIPSLSTISMGIDTISVSTDAEDAIEQIDEAISKVSMVRTDLGAFQNRLEHSLRNVENYNENLMAAESRISDANMAKEMVDLAKDNILQQATQAMLAQANSTPSGILQLLK